MFFFQFISFGEACHPSHVSRFVVLIIYSIHEKKKKKLINFKIEKKIVHKKTPKYDFDDLFVDDLFEADLFAPPVQKITQNEVIAEAQKLSSMSINPEGSKTGKRRLSARSIAVKRAALLNKHIYFLKPRLGSTPSVHPNIRPRTWLTMMQLAKDGDDMKKILELIPILHEGGGALPSVFAEEFVREWHHFFFYSQSYSHIHKH